MELNNVRYRASGIATWAASNFPTVDDYFEKIKKKLKQINGRIQIHHLLITPTFFGVLALLFISECPS